MDSTNPLDQPVASNLKILEEGLNHEVTQYLPHQFPKCTSASIITIPIREFQLLASLAGTGHMEVCIIITGHGITNASVPY